MFKRFKDIYGKDPRLKYKKKVIPHYGVRNGKLYFYGKNIVQKYNWDHDIIVPWENKFLKSSKNWLSINIMRDKFYIHPTSLRGKYISFIFRKRWKQLPQKISVDYRLNNTPYINSLEDSVSKLKYVHPIISDVLKNGSEVNNWRCVPKPCNVDISWILLKSRPKFNQVESTAIKRLYNHYSFKYAGHSVLKLNSYFINWNLINIYSCGVLKYLKVHPEWKEFCLSPQMIISKKSWGEPIYLDNYMYSPKWHYFNRNYELNRVNKSIEYFDYYSPFWCDMIHEKSRPLITAHNKRNLLKFPELFYEVNSYAVTHKELENIIKLINSHPEMTKKILINVKNSNCIEYVKQDYYKNIMLNAKPMYYSLYQHYLIQED